LFEEECEKFDKYIENEQTKTEQLEEETKRLTMEKVKINNEMMRVNRLIQETQSEIYKVED